MEAMKKIKENKESKTIRSESLPLYVLNIYNPFIKKQNSFFLGPIYSVETLPHDPLNDATIAITTPESVHPFLVRKSNYYIIKKDESAFISCYKMSEVCENLQSLKIGIQPEDLKMGQHFWAKFGDGSLVMCAKTDNSGGYEVCGAWECGTSSKDIEIIELIDPPKGFENAEIAYVEK